LGYNRRAKYLWESAKIITEKYNRVLPASITLLDELPGVGVNTAAAIVVYAFNKPEIFIETNIRRVFIHHFFEEKTEVSDNEILPLVAKSVDKQNPREWYWALMDYGSHLPKITSNPNRKSKHYAKQSPFEGSIRQVRGSILRILLSEKNISIQKLAQQISGDPKHFEVALAQLEKEKFVRRIDESIALQ
jgi:A/G-specific adenine glycosylase